jgi:spore coat protein U-like protein
MCGIMGALFCSAVLAAPISIVNNGPLSFGTLVRASGTVTVSPTGLRASSGPLLLASHPGSAALFTVSGHNQMTYTVTLPAGAVLSHGASTMIIDSFTSQPSTLPHAGQLGSSGTQTLTVGATLHVSQTQVTGTYSGTFSVTVNIP